MRLTLGGVKVVWIVEEILDPQENLLDRYSRLPSFTFTDHGGTLGVQM